MPLQKETVTINFSQGLDTIDDPNQLPIGRFVTFNNAVFIKNNTGEVGAFKKRNGFQPLAASASSISFLINYNESLVGLGQGSIQQYSPNIQSWVNQGYYQPVSLNVKSLIKNSYSQSQQDIAIAPNNIGCVAYNLGDPSGSYNYAIFDSSSGQIVSGPNLLNTVATTTYAIGQVKTFTLGSSFFVVYGVTSSGNSTTGIVATKVNTFLPFSSSTLTVSQSAFITNNSYLISSGTTNVFWGALFDGVVASSNIVLSYVTKRIGSNGNNIVGAKISPTAVVSSATIAVGSYSCSAISTCFDQSTSTVYTTIGSFTSVTYLGTDYNFSQTFPPTQKVISSFSLNYVDPLVITAAQTIGVSNIGSIANNGIMFSFYDIATFYSALLAAQNLRTDNICLRPVTSTGVVGSETIIGPSLGLASKPFFLNGSYYLFGTNQDNFQPSYFLISSTGQVVSQFSYGNAGYFYNFGIPSVYTSNQTVFISNLKQDLLVPQNSGVVGSNSDFVLSNPFYSQTGINYSSFTFTASSLTAIQSGNIVSASGGFLWNYDGLTTFENNYFIFPEIVSEIVPVGSGESVVTRMSAQQYRYQAVIESMDNQGNISRSSPGIGVNIPGLSLAGVGSAFAQIEVTTPRLSYRNFKNPMKLSLYRWSQAQPIFYKLGSLIYNGKDFSGSILPTLTYQTAVNSLNASNGKYDSVSFLDTTGDGQILGNEIIYTNGNIVEDTPAPSFIATDIWDQRFWGISAEDGSIWYSKPIVQNTPIEMSGNFSISIPPSQTSQGTAQQPVCLAPLDEKQIFFCKSSILFINGSGPDATGSNYQYSQPEQIPSQVGCSNQNSIVQTPLGLMFQSDNGIWLLDRNLAVRFIGKEVEAYNSIPVTSAVCVPGTSEVRFSLNNGTRLVFDMLSQQWGTFSGLPIKTGTIVQGLDTVLATSGLVYQETPNAYLDGATPVVMSFTTGWINLTGLQGYSRAYWLDILASFQSPHIYTIGVAFDYNPTIVQTATINPNNVVGSGSSIEQWQINFQRTQCQSIQLTFNEISSGIAGAGIVISGMSLTYGKKKTFARNISPANRIG